MNQSVAKRATREEILKASVSLFARHGYAGVSMREIASLVGVQVPALYYYFPNKDSLYMAVMAYALRGQLTDSVAILRGKEPPIARLERFIEHAIRDMADNPDFLQLLQRERLDGDEARNQRLVEEVFQTPLVALMDLLREIAPTQDSYLLSQSIAALMMYPLENATAARSLPGWRPEYADPSRLAQHICRIVKLIVTAEA